MGASAFGWMLRGEREALALPPCTTRRLSTKAFAALIPINAYIAILLLLYSVWEDVSTRENC
jgi:hypothetical protein